jgi:hypothetical protein
LKILYTGRHIFYIDHLVYALHIHTFAYTGVMLIVLATIGLNHIAPGTITGWIIALLWIAFVVQIFLSIRRVYRQGWFHQHFQIPFWRICVSDRPGSRACRDRFSSQSRYHEKTGSLFALAVAFFCHRAGCRSAIGFRTQ